MTRPRGMPRTARAAATLFATLLASLLASLLATVALAGCGRGVGPGAGTPPSSTGPSGTGGGVVIGTPDHPRAPAFTERARAVAAAWRTSGALAAWSTGLVPLEDLTQIAGFDDRGDLKAAVMEGRIDGRAGLPDTPSTGVATFPDGSTMPVPLVGARTALAALAPAAATPCATDTACATAVVTGATLGTASLLTSRGTATVPAWRFDLAGLSRPLVRVALAPSALTAPPEAPDLGAAKAEVGVGSGLLLGLSGTEIRYQLLIGACDTDPRGLVHEEADIVVVGGEVTPPRPEQTCIAMLVAAPVTVTTASPVGNRPVVDAVTGQAVLPPRTPIG